MLKTWVCSEQNNTGLHGRQQTSIFVAALFCLEVCGGRGDVMRCNVMGNLAVGYW